MSADAIGSIVAVSPTPLSTYPPGGTQTLLGINAGPFVTSSTLTSTTAGDPATGTSSASATVQQLAVNLGILGSLSLTGVNSSCSATPNGATGSGVIASGTATVDALPPVALQAHAAPNTSVNLAGLGTLTLNEQSTDANGVLTVNAAHLVLLPQLGAANVVVGHVQCGGAAPAPSVTKTAAESSFVEGQTLHYTFHVKNNGTQQLSNIAVTDNGPGSPTVSCPNATLLPGASENCTATYTATAADVAAGEITDTGTVTATLPGGGTVTGSSSSLTVPLRALSITKSAIDADFQAPGETVHYTYTVTNTGQAPLTNVVVTDVTPGVTVSGCGTNQLGPGQSTTCQATYITTAADVAAKTITDQGTVTATDSNEQTVTASSNTVTTPLAALSVVKTASPARFTAAGQTIHFTFHVTNNGTTPVSNISVVDTGPGAPAVTCPATSLAPGASVDCTATYVTTDADVAAGKITDTATVSGTTESGQIITTTSQGVTTVPLAGLKVVKAVEETAYSAPGQTLHFTFTVTNTGGENLSSLAVADNGAGSPTVTCPVTTLAPGASTICTATYTTTEDDVEEGRITDNATVTVTDPEGGAVTATSNTLAIVKCTPCEDHDHGGCKGDHPGGHEHGDENGHGHGHDGEHENGHENGHGHGHDGEHENGHENGHGHGHDGEHENGHENGHG
ncbi:hypothetical protein UK12_31085, partial [Saccharothrix sp. ST-888]